MSGSAPDPAEAQDSRGPQRVVLRGVRAVVLDDLTPEVRSRVIEALGGVLREAEAWIAVAVRTGDPDTAVKAWAGKSGAPDAKPGTYKALPHGSWFAATIGVEAPLP